MYSVGRLCILQKLTDKQVKNLHEREDRRQFLFPASFICSIYRLSENVIINFSDDNKLKLNDLFYKNLPDLANLPGMTAPSPTDLDYNHAWDWCLWNNIEVKEFLKNHSGTKNSIIDGIKSRDHMKGAIED